jgi:uncharacterized protein YaiL (DUF2058 family)
MPPCYGYQIHDIDNELQLLCKYLWDPIQQNHLKQKQQQQIQHQQQMKQMHKPQKPQFNQLIQKQQQPQSISNISQNYNTRTKKKNLFESKSRSSKKLAKIIGK